MEQAREGHLAGLTYVELQEDGRWAAFPRLPYVGQGWYAKPAVRPTCLKGIATWNDFVWSLDTTADVDQESVTQALQQMEARPLKTSSSSPRSSFAEPWRCWARGSWQAGGVGSRRGAGGDGLGEEGGLNVASHMMGWGAATGGGTDSDASRASRAPDAQTLNGKSPDTQTLNGMQESGAVDHFQVQELRRQQRPQVFRIDTESESDTPRPQQQIVARSARRPRAQAQTFFRAEQRAHPRLFRQRPLAHQPAVVVRPTEERTRTCLVVKGHAKRH